MIRKVIMDEDQAMAGLPQPPDMKRIIRMYPMQRIGMGLIALIPILALLGVFGETRAQANASNAAFSVSVDYPINYRYRVHNPLTVRLHNTSQQAYATVTVAFSTDYISPFTSSQFEPELDRMTGEAYEVDLNDVQPGETRIVTVVLEGQEYGAHSGVITATAEGAGAAQVGVATFVFP
jgi:hypothetical protein